MNSKRLHQLLECFPLKKVLVMGDFFLDQYLMLDRDISEISVETNLESYQVRTIRNSPGAAGTVTNNLRALDVNVTALGAIGDDGRGYDLKKELRRRNVDISNLIESDLIMTPTYTKPMMSGKKEPMHELERMDIKNRSHMPAEIEKKIISHMKKAFPESDGMIIVDQVQEKNCGVMTDAVIDALAELALQYPEKPILVDSRLHTADFRNIILKCNESEALQASGKKTLEEAAAALFEKNPRGAFISLGEKGMFVCEKGKGQHVPGIHVDGPIDIVGAGDSAASGIISTLCSGGTFAEAGEIGNLIASITIRQIGTTGTAKRSEVEAVNAEQLNKII